MTDPLGLIGRTSSILPQQACKPAGGADAAAGPSFKDVLMKNLEQVNKVQQEASAAIEDLQAGRRDDISGVMAAQKKAETAFKMLMQVRNKLMDAYDEVKQMRV
jgi:flagellar hook-basal body complex protein FliE